MIPNDESALNELTTWYQSGNGYSEALETLKDFITKNFIPDIRVKSIHGGSCVTAQVYYCYQQQQFQTILALILKS